jgi:hypothetical protein
MADSEKLYKLKKGAKYDVTVLRSGRISLNEYGDVPSHGFTAFIRPDTSIAGNPSGVAPFILKDPQGILGVHDESDPFFAQGKKAELVIPKITSETQATIPNNQKRTKIGVAERVNLKIEPASLTGVTWQLVGDPKTSMIIGLPGGATARMTAGDSNCSPSVQATIDGKTVKLDFQVVEPSAEVATKDHDLTLGELRENLSTPATTSQSILQVISPNLEQVPCIIIQRLNGYH